MSASNLSFKTLLLGLGLALALSGCGTKGPLEPPPSATPAIKPAAKTDEGIGSLPTIGQKKTETKPVEVPNKPFFFDFLL